ncbi:methylated-DNA--[protein]-cysteine S-methyltransferase [Microbacterium lacus]|uniref:methylated-DNA--[protein]-cysteine S-methyltransferase n=1 Tax=Microbacterium lacus TaxID=415217 RepID=UPI00384AB314
MTTLPTPHFCVHPSPLGDILIVTAGGGIVLLHPVDDVDAALDNAALMLRALPVLDTTDAAINEAARQLDEYFSGGRRAFELPLDWGLISGFTLEALKAVCDIPYGETAGYGEVAITAGSPGAARAVGTACARTPFSIVVPVHRVVRADGSLGEYGGRPEMKKYLIDLEQNEVEQDEREAAGV